MVISNGVLLLNKIDRVRKCSRECMRSLREYRKTGVEKIKIKPIKSEEELRILRNKKLANGRASQKRYYDKKRARFSLYSESEVVTASIVVQEEILMDVEPVAISIEATSSTSIEVSTITEPKENNIVLSIADTKLDSEVEASMDVAIGSTSVSNIVSVMDVVQNTLLTASSKSAKELRIEFRENYCHRIDRVYNNNANTIVRWVSETKAYLIRFFHYTLLNVAPDGNCMYHAVSVLLQRYNIASVDASQIRIQVVNFLLTTAEGKCIMDSELLTEALIKLQLPQAKLRLRNWGSGVFLIPILYLFDIYYINVWHFESEKSLIHNKIQIPGRHIRAETVKSQTILDLFLENKHYTALYVNPDQPRPRDPFPGLSTTTISST